MVFWITRILVIILLLAVLHVVLGRYLRWDKTKQLQAEFDAADTHEASRDAFIGKGLADYDKSLRKKLLWGIWLLPIGIGATLITLAATM